MTSEIQYTDFEYKGHPVRVIDTPGFFDTPSTHAALSADHVRTIRGEVPLRRLGEPAEVGHAVRMVFENGYLNGIVLPVHGGISV